MLRKKEESSIEHIIADGSIPANQINTAQIKKQPIKRPRSGTCILRSHITYSLREYVLRELHALEETSSAQV
jgi:hypothetical protein